MKKLLIVPLAALAAACVSAPPPPPPAPYRALGTEPFWNLIIDNQELTFLPMEGPQVRQPRPQPIMGVAGEIYRTPRIHVNIVRNQRCSDGMSDRVYPDRVQVDVDGRRFEGCGGA
jgi:heat shock protein HslJ